MVNLQQRPLPAPGYHIESLDGELLLFNPASDQILQTNQSGALVWQLCDGRRTIADITALLAAAYPDAAAAITDDVPAILAGFARHGAIHWQ
ncbi:MAG: PqqD family protein [Ardenticatenaceae bacterium]|nr:PqqD family protein [Ardenticatenaceae bacterium]MCB8987625.1 PqqD family protein [Ardenticatenaceae bacterium]